MHHLIRLLSIIALFLVAASCTNKEERKPSIMSGAFAKSEHHDSETYDLESIRKSGELIVGTISGPTTYYDYRGMQMGLHYSMIQKFAVSEGVSVRVELAHDTIELAQMLVDGTVDVVAYPLSDKCIEDHDLKAAGYSEGKHWAVSSASGELASALDEWYDHGNVMAEVEKEEKERVKQSQQVTRRAKAVYLSRERGVISIYDNLFKEAAAITGWDWKLIAAQCYQESAFDPNARSYVGAQGLMQLMPGTAKDLGLQPGEAFLPEKNINAAARYIVQIINTFTDIRDPQERLKFVLASYNGGTRHVRDAMALARKYGHDSMKWDEVAPYILGLQQPRYYQDPVVKHGYMIGSQTANYVQRILERWHDYGGKVAVTHAPQLPPESGASDAKSQTSGGNSTRNVRKNKYSSGQRIMTPDDPEFNQLD